MIFIKKIITHYFSNDNEEQKEKHNDLFKIIIDTSYQAVVVCFKYTYTSVKIFINVSGIYLLWIFLHYFASHLYVKLCVPNTIVGFLLSPFMIATPHCQGLRWIVYNAANMINNMWIILGAWICSTLLINPPLEKVEPN